jgi:hypothetical protein
MSIRGLIRSITASFRSPLGRVCLLAAYYLLIIAALILLYGKGDFSSTGFVYQGF